MRGRFPRPLTYFGPKVRAHDKDFALEKPPCKEGQSDSAPVVDSKFPRYSLDQLSEQRQEGSLDGKCRGPHDAEKRIDCRQRTEQQGQLAGCDNNGRIRRGDFIYKDDIVGVYH